MVPNYLPLCCEHILGPLFRRHILDVCSHKTMSIALETLALCHVSHFEAHFSRIMPIQSSREIFLSSKNAQTAPSCKLRLRRPRSRVRDKRGRLLSSIQKVVPKNVSVAAAVFNLQLFCHRGRSKVLLKGV